MVDQAAQQDLSDDGAEEAADAPERSAGRYRRRAIVGLAAAGVVAVLLVGLWWLGLVGDFGERGEQPPVFIELPEMTVNLSSVATQPQYLRVRASLEVSDDRAKAAVEPVLPRVLDAFQLYLRELRSTDLEGSAGLFRLKEELLRRVNIAIHPAEIDAVVFEEIIVQ